MKISKYYSVVDLPDSWYDTPKIVCVVDHKAKQITYGMFIVTVLNITDLQAAYPHCGLYFSDFPTMGYIV